MNCKSSGQNYGDDDMAVVRGIIDPFEQDVMRAKTKEVARLKEMWENKEITTDEYAAAVRKLVFTAWTC